MRAGQVLGAPTPRTPKVVREDRQPKAIGDCEHPERGERLLAREQDAPQPPPRCEP